MKTKFLLLFPLLMTGCFENHSPQPEFKKECFEIMPQHDNMRPVMYDKCTGDSWMLINTILKNADKDGPKVMTYRWQQLNKYPDEPELSFTQ